MRKNIGKAIIVLLLVIILLIGIIFILNYNKEYKKLSYIDYNEYFNNKDNYMMIDHSSDSSLEIIRKLEAGNGTIQIMYLEFENEEDAEKYIDDNYNETGYKIKNKNNYTLVKSTNNIYFKLYKVDNVIVYGVSEDKKDRREINSILKDLGY